MIGVSGCSSMFFFPQKSHLQTPDQLGLEYEDVYLESGIDISIHGWWLSAKAPLQGTVYFLHGNAENISTHIHNVAWLPEYGYEVFLIDYRGFGLSQGSPDLPGALEDIRTGFQYLLERNANREVPVYLLGQSLGASMALYFAATDPHARQNLDAVISDAAFTRYSDITRHATGQSWLTWALQYPASWSMIRGYDPLDFVADISPVPLLLIHSTDDPIIPYAYSQQLFQVALPPKSFLGTNGPHTATFGNRDYRNFLLEYLQTTAPGGYRGHRQGSLAP
jgi:fermentation-respiration switch protein FrsA (DUF1100 family)